MNDKPENKYTIDETLEVITYADVILEKLIAAKANDGKIDGGEIAASLAASAPEGVKALWGSWSVPKELGDLTPEETKTLLEASFPVVAKLFGLFVPTK